MTTRVTITTHDWPVLVSPRVANRIEVPDGPSVTVPPHSEQHFAVWQSRQLVIKELPKPDANGGLADAMRAIGRDDDDVVA